MNSNRRTIKILSETADCITQKKGNLSYSKFLNEAVKYYVKHKDGEQFLEDKINSLEKEILVMSCKIDNLIDKQKKRKWHWRNLIRQLHI